ncbi:VOC family protein [Nocardioides donggukensis]|uniref:VOC domain-containing protein n=1 Tax=Nocardioides donggukensis TaxID=2774019 RepID=A0A927PZK1_9ACTN|nr:VOC family protein [Nocardioides donggukensis]MBD8870343.1 hypothetical protein [Nocardioides donggukensis]
MSGDEGIGPATPLLIVSDVDRSLSHYVERLGFTCVVRSPAADAFFAIVERDAARIMLKSVGPEVSPLPNPQRHAWARWDVFIHAPDPASLAAELADRGVDLHQPLGVDDDDLLGLATMDPDGYVCFFGRPNT